jgi:hypothetical protein
MHGNDRRIQNPISRQQIALEQHRRHRQHVADIVESVSGIVVRKCVRRLQVQSDQVANRIVVFGTIESPDRHPSGIGIRRVNRMDCVIDPLDESRALLCRRLLLFCRRHQPVVDVEHDPIPDL